MGAAATKAVGNVYYEARKKAAMYNDRLSSREGAAEALGISPSTLADYELGLTKFVPVENVICKPGTTAIWLLSYRERSVIVCCESTLSQWQSGNYTSGLRFGLSNAICVPCLLKSAPAAVSKAKAKACLLGLCTPL